MFSLITVASKQYPHDIHVMSNRSIFDMCHGQTMEYTPYRRMVINPLIRVGISLPSIRIPMMGCMTINHNMLNSSESPLKTVTACNNIKSPWISHDV